MKRILALCLALLMLFPLLAACGEKEEEAGEEITELMLGNTGESVYRVIFAAGDGSMARRALADKIASAVKKNTGSKISVASDKEEPAPADYEILVGNTNRAASAELYETVKGEKERYAIKVSGNSLVFVGSSDFSLSEAVAVFLKDSGSSLRCKVRDKVWTVPVKLDTLVNVIAARAVGHIGYVSTAEQRTEGFKATQGGCTDGTYAYYCMENQAGDYSDSSKHTTRIAKVDLTTGRQVAVSEPYPLDHSNDMAYNSKTNELMIVHNGRDNKRISVMDPATLTVTRTFTIKEGIFALAYNEKRDRYVVGVSGGMDLEVFDPQFSTSDYYATRTSGHTTQGIDCDDDYIYCVQSGKGTTEEDGNFCYLLIYTWTGKFVAEVRVELPAGETKELEAENTFHIGRRFFITHHSADGGHIHEIELIGLFDD